MVNPKGIKVRSIIVAHDDREKYIFGGFTQMERDA
jgi:hypothetical protein